MTSNTQTALYALFDSNYVLNKRIRTVTADLAAARSAAQSLAADNARLKTQLANDARRNKTRVLRPVHASLGLECEYRRRLQCLIDEMNASVRYWLCAKYKGNEPEVSQLEDEDRELALDAQLHPDVLRHAQDYDKLGYLTGAEIQTSGQEYWNAHYDFDNDLIVLRPAFFKLSFLEQVHVLLHEGGHRGQAFDQDTFEEFKRLGLDKVKSFVQMANRVHLEDYQRTGEIDGGVTAEVFAEGYSRWCLGLDMPEELRVFWDARMAATASEAAPSTGSQAGVASRLPPPAVASDAALPANALRRAVRSLARRWQKRFNEAASGLARWFAINNRRRSTEQLRRILRDGGWSVELKLSQAQRDILQATIHENVSLIRSIPQQYFTQIEGMVMRSVQSGRDLYQLTKDLRRQFGVTKRRAELIARDQNNKVTAVLRRTQQLELGIVEAVWVHSHAGKTPRRTHLANDGKKFDVKKGWFDPDPKVRRRIQPGELINCGCFSRSVIPGFA